MVPATVLAETCYLIDRALGPTAEAAFLDSVGMGPDCTFQLVELVDSENFQACQRRRLCPC